MTPRTSVLFPESAREGSRVVINSHRLRSIDVGVLPHSKPDTVGCIFDSIHLTVLTHNLFANGY